MRKAVNGLLILLCCMCSCAHQLGKEDYVQFVKDNKNGLNKTIEAGEWVFSMQYKPYDYILLFESNGDMKSDQIKERRSMLKGTAWFNISFGLAGKSISPMRYNLASTEEYNVRLNYFLNEARQNVQLVYGTDTLRPSAYLFENNFNLAPMETMVVGFDLPGESDRPEKDMWLSYNDLLFKNGIIKAKYTTEVLNAIPNLSY